uniref:Uncharacterized protein n=1 Tax=Rhodopseudomonas palustris (strain BisA53) TaxID=316055 RepID=Q07L05_RHOP5
MRCPDNPNGVVVHFNSIDHGPEIGLPEWDFAVGDVLAHDSAKLLNRFRRNCLWGAARAWMRSSAVCARSRSILRLAIRSRIAAKATSATEGVSARRT